MRSDVLISIVHAAVDDNPKKRSSGSTSLRRIRSWISSCCQDGFKELQNTVCYTCRAIVGTLKKCILRIINLNELCWVVFMAAMPASGRKLVFSRIKLYIH